MAIDLDIRSGVHILWEENLLVDYTIEVGDVEFKVHKVIMASVSDFFKVMLTGSMVESRSDKVRLEGLNSTAVASIINLIYTNTLDVSGIGANDLLSVAMYLQIPKAIDACANLLMKEISIHNCFNVLSTFQDYGLIAHIDRATKYIWLNINDILQTVEPNSLSFYSFVNLIDFWGKSEYDIFCSINEWVNADVDNRQSHQHHLLESVRYGLMSSGELKAIKETYEYQSSENEWRNFVNQAEEYHALPDHQKLLDISGQNEVRNKPKPVCFVADLAPHIFYTLTHDEAWEERKLPREHSILNSPAAVLEVNNFLIVCDNFCSYQSWSIFDPRTLSWSRMASMPKPRDAFAMSYLDGHLYVSGGIQMVNLAVRVLTDSIERYDFSTNTWMSLDAKLPLPLQGHKACSLDGKIYTLGGWGTFEKDSEYSSMLHCFDPTNWSWITKEAIENSTPGQTLFANKYKTKNVLLVIGAGFNFQIYSPEQNQWLYFGRSVLDTRLEWHLSGILLADYDTMYLLNFLQMEEENNGAAGFVGNYVFGRRVRGSKLGGCAKWTLDSIWPVTTEQYVGDFPIRKRDHNGPERVHFSALLSIPSQSQNKVGDH